MEVMHFFYSSITIASELLLHSQIVIILFLIAQPLKLQVKNEKRRPNRACSCLMMILVLIRKVYDAICDLVFAIFYSNVEVKKIPPITNPLVRESAVSLAEKIRTQEVTE